MSDAREPAAPTGVRRGLTNYGDPEFSMFVRGAFARGMGLTGEDLSRPVIGIAQTWSEFNPCHRHLREVAEAVKRGVWQAGGLPLEFPTISLGVIHPPPTTASSKTRGGGREMKYPTPSRWTASSSSAAATRRCRPSSWGRPAPT